MPLKSLRRLMTNGGGCKCGNVRGWKVKVKVKAEGRKWSVVGSTCDWD